VCKRGGLSKNSIEGVLAAAIDRPIMRGTDVMQLPNALVTAAVRMLLNKAVSAVGVDGVKVAGKSWE